MKTENPQLISYNTLRRIVGILGIAFPIVLSIGALLFGDCDSIQKSISIYYHTIMRNFFVGILSAIGLFLFTYKGYDRIDNIAGTLAGIFAFGVAFFPCSITGPFTNCLPTPLNNGIWFILHLISAGALFVTLALFSIFLFTKTHGQKTKMKIKRNRLYRTCGIIMLVSIAIIGIVAILNHFGHLIWLQKYHFIFWLESISLWAFGTSWLVKGRAFWRD
jgi:hypothetical protein